MFSREQQIHKCQHKLWGCKLSIKLTPKWVEEGQEWASNGFSEITFIGCFCRQSHWRGRALATSRFRLRSSHASLTMTVYQRLCLDVCSTNGHWSWLTTAFSGSQHVPRCHDNKKDNGNRQVFYDTSWIHCLSPGNLRGTLGSHSSPQGHDEQLRPPHSQLPTSFYGGIWKHPQGHSIDPLKLLVLKRWPLLTRPSPATRESWNPVTLPCHCSEAGGRCTAEKSTSTTTPDRSRKVSWKPRAVTSRSWTTTACAVDTANPYFPCSLTSILKISVILSISLSNM